MFSWVITLGCFWSFSGDWSCSSEKISRELKNQQRVIPLPTILHLQGLLSSAMIHHYSSNQV